MGNRKRTCGLLMRQPNILKQMYLILLWCFLAVGSLRTTSSLVKVTVDVDTVVSVGGATKVPKVFGITAYSGSEMFVDAKGQDYLRSHGMDYVGLSARMWYVLPNSSQSMSLEELKTWFSGKGPTEMFKKCEMFPVLTSNGIRKGGASPFYFLVNGQCRGAEKAECSKNGTPLPLNGSTVEEKYAWWTELQTGMMTQVLGADPQLEYVHISNEPDLHGARDGFNVSHYIDFYHASVERLKGKWPHLKYGGPITWDPPNGPFGIRVPSTSFHTWFTFMKPFLDAVVPLGYLDFVDFHAYGNNTNPDVLEAALNVLNGYSWSKFHRTFQIAITESNNKIFDSSLERNHTYHYYYRTLPLVLATLALIRHPDQVITRLLFDFQSPGRICGCQLYINGSDTQELQSYALLGHLRDGTRLSVTSELVGSAEGDRIGGKQTGVLAEAVQSGTNYTLALVNTLDVAVTVKLEFNLPAPKPLPSWAGMMDVHSLRDIPAPQFPSDTVELPPKSIFLATYDNQKMPRTPKKKKEYLTIYPQDSNTIMVPITNATFEISVDFVIPSSILEQLYFVILQFGALGPPSHAVWTVMVDCNGNRTTTIVAVKPGIFYQKSLPADWVFDPSVGYKCSVHLKTDLKRSNVEYADMKQRGYSEKSERNMEAEKKEKGGHAKKDAAKDVHSVDAEYPAVFQFCSLLVETI